MALIAITMGVAAANLRTFKEPATSGASQLVGFMKQARAKALASTLAYTVKPASSTRVMTTFGSSCSATQTTDTSLSLVLPTGASLAATTWSVCFGVRGLADTSIDITVADQAMTKVVQVALGGGARVE